MKAAIISFCSNDYRFIDACIAGVRPFAEQMIVTVADHFFDGSKENGALLDLVYGRNPDCLFIEYPFVEGKVFGTSRYLQASDPEFHHHCHNTNRLVGFYYLKPEVDWVFFVDSDEIIEGEKMAQFLRHSDLSSYQVVRFASYWYLQDAKYRTRRRHHTVLATQREALNLDHFLDVDERMGMLFAIPGRRMGNVYGLDGCPMVHHYSFVRRPSELKKKLETWGHKADRQWNQMLQTDGKLSSDRGERIKALVEETVPYFDPLAVVLPNMESAPSGTDQGIHQLMTQEETAFFEEGLLQSGLGRKQFSHVAKPTVADLHRKELICRYNL